MTAERPGSRPQEVLITFPEGARLVDASKSEVLYNLVDIHGQPAGPRIISHSFCNASHGRLLVIGEPGGNKSTVLGQYVRERAILSAQRKNLVKITPRLYDEELKRHAQSLSGLPRADWPLEEWTAFSGRMYDAVALVPDEEVVGEIVGISRTGKRDRAVSAMRRIAQDLKAEPRGKQSTLVVAIVPDPRSQDRSALIRKKILETSDADVFQTLLQNFNIQVEGLPNPDTPEGGAFIKAVMREMAEEDVIRNAQADVLEETKSWKDTISKVEFDERMAKIVIPKEVAGMTAYQLNEYYLPKAAHLEDYIYNQLGFTKEQAIVVFSPYTPDKIIHWPIPGVNGIVT